MEKSDKLYNGSRERDFYETGSTRPPKQNGGMVAFLLVMVILLGGICSALGILNIRLLQQLAQGQQEHEKLELFDDNVQAASMESLPQAPEHLPELGIHGQTVTEFDRRYYALPEGVLVTEVAEGYCADLAGVRPGDVICALEGRKILSREELTDALMSCESGQTVCLAIYRSQTQEEFSTTLTISDNERK